MSGERYVVRPVMVWNVIRCNKDGSEAVIETTASEEHARTVALRMNKEEGLDD